MENTAQPMVNPQANQPLAQNEATLPPTPTSPPTPAPPTPSQVAAPAQPVPKSNRSIKWLFLFLVLLLVIAIPLGLFYIAQTQINTPQPPIVVNPTPLPLVPTATPTPTPDPFASWGVFTTNKLTFKHPSEITVKQSAKNLYVFLPDATSSAKNADFTLDERLTGINSNFEKATASAEKNMINVSKENMTFPEGVKMYGVTTSGINKGKDHVIALIKYNLGAITFETFSSDSAKLTIFNQILSTMSMQPASTPDESAVPSITPTLTPISTPYLVR